MNARSPFARLAAAYRDFGLGVATRVAYSKIRGKLFPALALPDGAIDYGVVRELSILLSTATHPAATITAVIEAVSHRGGSAWEICLCARAPLTPETAATLAPLRGSQPWLRIVTASPKTDEATALRWTLEQATGQFVALVATEHAPDADAFATLIARLQADPTTQTAMLDGTREQRDICQLMVQRKSSYLAAFPAHMAITAPALCAYLDATGKQPNQVTAGDSRR